VNQASLLVRLLPDNSMEGVGHDAAAVAAAAVQVNQASAASLVFMLLLLV